MTLFETTWDDLEDILFRDDDGTPLDRSEIDAEAWEEIERSRDDD